jgi:excisionase family DNA binding protein
MTPLLLTIPDAAKALCLSRTSVYELVRGGKLASVTVGRSRRIAVADVEAFVREHRSFALSSRRAA